MFRALLSCLPNAVLQSHPYKYGHAHIIRYIPGFLPRFHSEFARIFAKKSSEFFTKMSSDEELVTLHLNHTRNHWNNTVYTLYLDALYGVLMQYVLLYCDFVTILSRFTLFCSDLRCFVAIYAVLSRRHDCSGLFPSHLRTFLSNFVVTDVYALSLKFLKSLPAVFFPFLV